MARASGGVVHVPGTTSTSSEMSPAGLSGLENPGQKESPVAPVGQPTSKPALPGDGRSKLFSRFLSYGSLHGP
jgi:hypothetical protein